MCKELQLPDSEYNHTADLVAVTSAAPLEAASVQAISVLAVSAEGTARLWPSLAQEGNYTETDVDPGDLCNFVVAVRVSTSVVELSGAAVTSLSPALSSFFIHSAMCSPCSSLPSQGGTFILSSVKNRLLRASADSSGKLQCRALMHGHGMLSGIGRRVSSLFGILAPPVNDTVSRPPGRILKSRHIEINWRTA